MLDIEESQLEPGARVAERYRLDHVLGEGGMGVVWEAHDETTGEGRALKFIRTDKCGDARSIARLLREARAASAVSHPNVARVFEVLELPEGTPFLVMERLHGETLKTRLARVGKLSPDELGPIGVAIASGVRAAHALGIVHRDLKPDNVFVLSDGGVKVIDFGIAKELRSEGETELTTTGAMLGTLHYMAPEQVFGDVDIDERADVWALGVVLYECLAGRRPTEGSGSGQVLKAIMTRAFTPLAVASPGCPGAVSDLVARMLSRERTERPSLDEVVDVLEGRAARTPRSVKAVAAVETTAPRSRSRMIAALVGLAAVGATAGAVRFVVPPEASPPPSGGGAVSAIAPSSAPSAGPSSAIGALPSAGGSTPPVSAGVDPVPVASTVTVTSAKVVVAPGPKAGASASVKAMAPRASDSASPAPTVTPSAPSSSGSPALPPLATSRRS